MKIWFPTIRARSGSDVYVVRLAEGLRRLGVEAEVTWFGGLYELLPDLLGRVTPPPGTDVIHANTWNGFAFFRPGIPLVVTEHHCVLDPAYAGYRSPLQAAYHELLVRRCEKRSLSRAMRIVAVSHYTAASVQRSLGFAPHAVIHNYVDTERFRPASEAAVATGPFRLLFVGNPVKRKGSDLLPLIMARLGAGYQLRLTAGLRAARRCGYPANTELLGSLGEDALIAEYQQCHALLFPSRFEGFGYAVVEAMACGKPVIATDATSIPELVENGRTGILCSPDDVDGFVRACRRLAENSMEREAMGQRARQRALDMFSEERIIRQYIALYEDLAK